LFLFKDLFVQQIVLWCFNIADSDFYQEGYSTSNRTANPGWWRGVVACITDNIKQNSFYIHKMAI